MAPAGGGGKEPGCYEALELQAALYATSSQCRSLVSVSGRPALWPRRHLTHPRPQGGSGRLSHPTSGPQAALAAPLSGRTISCVCHQVGDTHGSCGDPSCGKARCDVLGVVPVPLPWTVGGTQGWDETPDTQPLLSLPPSTAGHPGVPWGGPGAAVGLCKVLVCIRGPECMQVAEMWLRLENIGYWT